MLYNCTKLFILNIAKITENVFDISLILMTSNTKIRCNFKSLLNTCNRPSTRAHIAM